MKSKSINGNSIKDIQTALEKSMYDGFKPTIAVAFISVNQDIKSICEILHQKQIQILGASSCGEFADGYQDEGTIVILLMELKPQSFTVLYEDIGKRELSDVCKQIARNALQKFNNPSFILCSTSLSAQGEFLINGDTLIRSIESVIGPNVNIYGGMAGDDWNLKESYVFTNKKSTDYGIVALILDEDQIELQGMAISGWKPIGITRTVTKSEGKMLYTIDGKSAVDMYLKYLGGDEITGEEKYKMFEELGIFYPFHVEREVGEPTLISPMEISVDKNALICESAIPQGAKLRFSSPPDFDIVEKVLERANELKAKSYADADAMIIFSCAGRKSTMGPLAKEENQGLCKLWNSPMAGFYSYGEFGRALNGRPEFHSTTNSWVALKEK